MPRLTWPSPAVLLAGFKRSSPFLFLYAALGVMGFLYVRGKATPIKLTQELSDVGSAWWPWCLLVGGILGVVSSVRVERIPALWSMVIEATGAWLLVIDVALYTALLIGPKPPLWTIYTGFGVALALLHRAIQVGIELRRWAVDLQRQEDARDEG